MALIGERAQVFGTEGNLVGIVTEPQVPDPDLPAVVLLNAGIIHRVGPSRFGVEMTRVLAEAGHRTLRFDLSGIGDSDPAREGRLTEIVQRDIRDAITLAAVDRPGVVLVGLCSGADSAFYVGADDARVRGLVLIDPWIPRTAGFRRRKLVRRMGERSFWGRVVTGRLVSDRIRRALPVEEVQPPGYYRLLTCSPEDQRRRAALMTGRGVQFLYVLTGGASDYFNASAQVEEAIPCFAGNLRTEWREDADHLLSRAADRAWLYRTTREWMDGWMRRPRAVSVGGAG